MAKQSRKTKQQTQRDNWRRWGLLLFVIACTACAGFYKEVFNENNPPVKELIDAGVPLGWTGLLVVTLLSMIGIQSILLTICAAVGTKKLLS